MLGEPDEVVIIVHNFGDVIPPSELFGIFSPFKRLRPGAPVSRDASNLGLGLFIAIVAGRFAMGATGTDTGGSIRQPAAFSGIVGIKPTLGLISRSGIIPIAHSQDTAGPMARTVRDAALETAGVVRRTADVRERAGGRMRRVQDFVVDA